MPGSTSASSSAPTGSGAATATTRSSGRRSSATPQLLLPPELIGCHVGPPRAHTTGRTQALSFRAITALFGHFGIEWDIASASPQEREELAGWVALHKELRPLLHTGTVVRADRGPADVLLHGVVAPDGARAVYAAVQLTQSVTSAVGRVRLPGLDPRRTYRVEQARDTRTRVADGRLVGQRWKRRTERCRPGLGRGAASRPSGPRTRSCWK